MCGICGVVQLDDSSVAVKTLDAMNASIAHRGPDGHGSYLEGPVGLAHRRLAIIDLTETGRQPMGNEDGTVLITYSGEIYNYRELRSQLEPLGHRFRSQSDTEVIVHAYEEWGEASVSRLNGHFAYAIWDSRKRRLFLARDRFGTRPLYYFTDGKRFIFGSEVKAILAHPDVPRGVDLAALDEYFTFQNILTDLTLFKGVHLLPPGCLMTVEAGSAKAPVTQRYWDYHFDPDPPKMVMREAADELQRLFTQAVTRQLMSEVPLGCYLSGGMDSGSITATARANLGRLCTFTLGFDLSSASGLELGFDERAQAEALSNLLKTEHYEMVLHAGDMEQVLPALIWHVEDLRVGQCYPNYYVARLASKFVKVVLSGAGGDELFGGYPWRYYRGLNAPSDQFHRSYYDFWQRLVSDDDKRRLFRADVQTEIGNHSTFDVFRSVLDGGNLPLETPEDRINACLYFELKSFLHGLLVVEDRISFAHGLETRAPFLDNDLVDFALRVPVSLKLDADSLVTEVDEDDVLKSRMRTSGGKRVLREAMSRSMPALVTGRAKQGFSAPDASWFRGESIDYVNSLLRDRRSPLYEFLDPDFVASQLDEHTSGRVNHRLFIWSLLSFEWWLRNFGGGDGRN
jgi:asparagine synthase (glutamine-hydrolysing)